MTPRFDIDAAWAILQEHCGAQPHLKGAFSYQMRHGGQEFRFGGGLGSGGKFHNAYDGRIYVSAYPEDLTEIRIVKIERANAALKLLLGKV